MKASISKSEIKGRVSAPSSKSYTIRGLVTTALANGQSEIISPLGSDDTEAAMGVLNNIGVSVVQGENRWRVNGGNFHEPTVDLFCRESAATLRFMTAISALVPGKCRLTAQPSLARRPIEPLLQALRQLGVVCLQDETSAVIIKKDRLRGGVTELPGNISSQFVSALLFISPCADEAITIRLTTPLESQPFVLMTIECLEKFGIKVDYSADFREYRTARQIYRPTRYQVEGDWSSASYLLALGALGGEIEVTNLNPSSLQGDRVILDFLMEMGASITVSPGSIIVRKSSLKAIEADLTDCIDLLPTMAVLAAAAEGTSRFSGIARAHLKESDRPSAVGDGLTRMGVKITEKDNILSITGSLAKGAVIDSYGDHRIAMAFSLPGILAGDTIIDGAECVSKTYPEFWDILKVIGGEVKLDE